MNPPLSLQLQQHTADKLIRTRRPQRPCLFHYNALLTTTFVKTHITYSMPEQHDVEDPYESLRSLSTVPDLLTVFKDIFLTYA